MQERFIDTLHFEDTEYLKAQGDFLLCSSAQVQAASSVVVPGTEPPP
jgi:hypothetical protein